MAAERPAGPSAVFTGARARFSMGGRPVGYATNCNGSEEVVYEPIEVLDHVQVVEFAPVGYRVSFTAGRVRLIGRGNDTDRSWRQAGFFPRVGQNAQEHLQNILNLNGGDDLVATVEDVFSGDIFMTLDQVKVATRGWAITPRGIVGEDVGFVGVKMRDETEQG